MNNKIYQSMPFITNKHLKEYYNTRQNYLVDRMDDLDTQIYIESLVSVESPVVSPNFCSTYFIPVTMPLLQNEL